MYSTLFVPQSIVACSVHRQKPRTRGVRYLLDSSMEQNYHSILKMIQAMAMNGVGNI